MGRNWERDNTILSVFFYHNLRFSLAVAFGKSFLMKSEAILCEAQC